MVSHRHVSPLLLLVACGTQPAATPAELVVVSPGVSSASAEPSITARVMHLAIYEVDEELDPFADLAAAPSVDDDVMLENERATHYAEVSLRRGETIGEAKERLVQFTRVFPLPAGRLWAFGRSKRGYLPGHPGGWRTYLVKAGPSVTDANVRSANLTRDERTPDQPTLHLSFDEDGTRALAELSERCIGRRIAFLIDGIVMVAPIVVNRMDGGEIVVWLDDLPTSEAPLRFASGVPIQRR